MKTISWVGIVLIVLGALALAYQGFSYTRHHNVIDMGPMHVTADTHEWVSLPPILDGLALVGGIVLVVMGARNKS
jgi:hypothetical protein